MNDSPPKWAKSLLLFLLRSDIAEEALGDLEEDFYGCLAKNGKTVANRRFVYQVFHYLRPFALKKIHLFRNSSAAMTQHNLLLAYRNLRKHKTTFLINLIGLSSALTCVMLIALWAQDEWQKDRFHQNQSSLYQVILHQKQAAQLRTLYETPGLLAHALQEEFPEVKVAITGTDASWFDNFTLSLGDKRLSQTGHFSGESYFEMFSYPLVAGEPSQVLLDKKAIVISERLAINLFGSVDNAIGKTLSWDILQYGSDAQVTGVFATLPNATSKPFDFVMPIQVYTDLVGEGIHWFNYNTITYVQLNPNSALERVNSKLKDFVENKAPESNITTQLVPYADQYLYGKYEKGVQAGGRIDNVYRFIVVAILVLGIACINFINLSTARATRKSKEIGIRKTIGAQRSGLVLQLLTESMLTIGITGILALLLTYFLLPLFNAFTEKSIVPEFTVASVLVLVSMLFITGLLAGSYPALYLSKFHPSAAIQQVKNSATSFLARKGLVTLQFCLSVLLISGVVVIEDQLSFVQSKGLGYDRDNVLILPKEGSSAVNLNSFLFKLSSRPEVEQATASHHKIVSGGPSTTGFHWPGKEESDMVRFGNVTVGKNFIPTMGVSVILGSDFSKNEAVAREELVINEAALEVMEIENPVGLKVNLWGEERTIVGVVKNFHFESLHHKVAPMLLRYDPEDTGFLLVKLNAGSTKSQIQSLKQWYAKENPGFPFAYSFLDAQFNAVYQQENKMAQLSTYFALLAIVLSCLGLFGLSAFSAEQRTKEIAIRKVLGAGSKSIVLLLSKDFSKTIVWAVILAVPIGYWLLSTWLSGFAYTIDLNFWHFGVGAVLSVVVAWVTVGYHTIRSTRINPVENLNSE